MANNTIESETNISDMLYNVSKQIEEEEARQANLKLLAQATESDSVKPTAAVIKRVERLEKDAFALFRQALHFFRPNELLLSFNGGKDCTVLLHLLHLFFSRNHCISHIRLPVIYIETDNTFEEINAIMLECERLYNITLIRRQGCIKEVLKDLLSEMPNIKAVFMGSRRTDPFCGNLNVMQATDPDWPSLVRIMPLIDWSYVDVWYYIFVRSVPYCKLYEEGYTSLGQKNNTRPNPHLRIVCPVTGYFTYKHAAELTDAKYERAGRGEIDYVSTCELDPMQTNGQKSTGKKSNEETKQTQIKLC